MTTLQPMAGLFDGHPWAWAASAALVAVVLAFVANRLTKGLLHRLFRHRTVPMAIVVAGERAAAAVWPLATLQFVWVAAPDTLPHIGSVRHANALLLIAAVTWLATSVIQGIANGVVASHPTTVEDNLHARRVQTQTNVLARSAILMVLLGGTAIALLTFPGARQVGASLLASAGVLGIVGGIAARPVFSNLIAGLQIALAQPIRIDDTLIVQGQFGRVEEINGTYVVLKLWDERRMIVPLQWFIENPFENWTHTTAQRHQSVNLYVDYSMPIEPLREELQRIVASAPEWDGRTANIKVTDSTTGGLTVRVLVSGSNASAAFDLGCKVREGLYAFLAREYADNLPQTTVALKQAVPAS